MTDWSLRRVTPATLAWLLSSQTMTKNPQGNWLVSVEASVLPVQSRKIIFVPQDM